MSEAANESDRMIVASGTVNEYSKRYATKGVEQHNEEDMLVLRAEALIEPKGPEHTDFLGPKGRSRGEGHKRRKLAEGNPANLKVCSRYVKKKKKGPNHES